MPNMASPCMGTDDGAKWTSRLPWAGGCQTAFHGVAFVLCFQLPLLGIWDLSCFNFVAIHDRPRIRRR